MSRKIYLILSLLVFVLMFASTVTAATSLTYVYDANGNLISGDGRYYEYNDANQLVKVKHGDQNGPVIAEYFYDYTGQRIKKVDNGVTTYYIGKHFETQTDGSNTQHTSYYFSNGERVAKKDDLGNVSYYHSDHLGGTNVVTDSSGNLVERIRYYPFGEIREGGNEKYQFTGKEKDKLTDFYYYEARYYDPEFKHFTQADTVAPNIYDPQDLNRYSYVRNNPLRYIDPTGHVWWNPFTWFDKKSQTPESTNLATVQLPTASRSPQVPPDTRTKSDKILQEANRIISDDSYRQGYASQKYTNKYTGQIDTLNNNCKEFIRELVYRATRDYIPSYEEMVKSPSLGDIDINNTDIRGKLLQLPRSATRIEHTALIVNYNTKEITVLETNFKSGEIAIRTDPINQFMDYRIYDVE